MELMLVGNLSVRNFISQLHERNKYSNKSSQTTKESPVMVNSLYVQSLSIDLASMCSTQFSGPIMAPEK